MRQVPQAVNNKQCVKELPFHPLELCMCYFVDELW